MTTQKANTSKTQFCNIPTPAEAIDIVGEFCNFATPFEYAKDLDEVIWWAISSELADNNPLQRSNHIYLINQIKQLLPALYVLYAGEVVVED